MLKNTQKHQMIRIFTKTRIRIRYVFLSFFQYRQVLPRLQHCTMSIITFISDFGLSDHYVSSVKASILKYNSSNQIIDISHEINKYDLSHAAHVFKNVFEEFPQGSIHIIAVKNYESADDLLLFQINNQYIMLIFLFYRVLMVRVA